MIGRKQGNRCIENVNNAGLNLIGNINTVLAIGDVGDMSGQGKALTFMGSISVINSPIDCSPAFDDIRALSIPTGYLWGSESFSGGDSTYLTTPYGADFDITTYSTPFSIDVWLYQITAGGWMQFINYIPTTTPSWGSYGWHFDAGGFGDTPTGLALSLTLDAKWTHVAVTRTSGGVYRLFKNGSKVAEQTVTANIQPLSGTPAYFVLSGTNFYPAYSYHGMGLVNTRIKNYRFTKGEALWTANFTPPTNWNTHYLATRNSNTKLLIPFSGDTAYGHVNNASHNITYNGNLKIVYVTLTTGKYASAFEMDGSDDYVAITGQETGIQSIDFWIFNDTNSRDIIKINSSSKISVDGSGNISLTNMSGWQCYVNGSLTNSIGTAAWKHVGLKKNTGDAMELNAGEIGRASTYFDGNLAHIRMEKIQLDYATLWSQGKLYKLEDAY